MERPDSTSRRQGDGLGLFLKPEVPERCQRNVRNIKKTVNLTDHGERTLSERTQARERHEQHLADLKAETKAQLQHHPTYNKKYNFLERCIQCKKKYAPCDHAPPPCGPCQARGKGDECSYPQWIKDEAYQTQEDHVETQEGTENFATSNAALPIVPQGGSEQTGTIAPSERSGSVILDGEGSKKKRKRMNNDMVPSGKRRR